MIETLIDLNHLRIVLAIGMLGYASYTDMTKREISDFVWIIFGADNERVALTRIPDRDAIVDSIKVLLGKGR